MDRFFGQPKFAVKTYMKFERQELEQRPEKRDFGRANSGLVFQEAQLSRKRRHRPSSTAPSTGWRITSG